MDMTESQLAAAWAPARTVSTLAGDYIVPDPQPPLVVHPPRQCRVCGCTENNPCQLEDNETCGWAEDMGDLCSGCVVPLESCTGETPECPHYHCPDGYHRGDDLPCLCTADCALGDDEED